MWGIIVASIGIAVATLAGTQTMLWNKVDMVSNSNNDVRVEISAIKTDVVWIRQTLETNAKQQTNNGGTPQVKR